MGAFNGRYPPDLGKVIAHAKRLRKVLKEIERGRADTWFLGRADELRGIVSLALADWRSGASDTERAGQAILSYVDTLHRGASRKLRCGLALECCELDDAITAVASDEAKSMAGVDTASVVLTQVTSGPTVPVGWVDSPEMLARVHNGLPLVEMHACAIARRIGHGGATMDDLRAFGREGLLDAARAFDERRGVPFDRWASLQIRSAMIDGVRRWGAVPARTWRRLRDLEATDSKPSATHEPGASDRHGTSESSDGARGALLAARPRDMAVGLGDGLDGLGVSPEDLVAKAQLASLVREIVAELPDLARALIERSYFNGQTLEQAAASIGVTPSWAHRVHARAIETMQRELRKRDRMVAEGGRVWGSKRS
jgi:RNA polymerase sigma factor for flagellar operon FliA